MPFVYNPEDLQKSRNKRRKTSDCAAMARRHWKENNDSPQDLEDSDGQSRDAAERREPIQTSNREELMECIKSGKSTVWIPSPALERLAAEHSTLDRELADQTPASGHHSSPQDLMVPSMLSPNVPILPQTIEEPIERPRSALHAGDFRQQNQASKPPKRSRFPGEQDQSASFDNLGSSPPPWLVSTPIPSFGHFNTDPENLANTSADRQRRTRAPSLGSSLSSSFVMRVPTSPLVNATSHTSYDPDVPSMSTSPDKTNRRKTLPPEGFRSLQSIPADDRAPNFSRPFTQSQMIHENSLPARGHQPRRSLTSFTYQPAPTAHMPPFLRTRRPSASSDASPRASMVGSFEESILRGRMSTAPSRPIDFVAQIGVLGKGNCKPSLRCPAHAIVPFPAVFYNYTGMPNGRSAVNENPSPYVGTIDLEHHLKPVETARQRRQKLLDARDPDELMADITGPENTTIGRALARDARAKRPETPPKAPPGGCYRIPQVGQLQIIIKNPNKTAVKLYLVPYDLTGMEPGTKTFIRQRSYSSGPILDMPVSADVQNRRYFDSLQDKHILRYLVHLKICCLSKDRFYLYDNIRVVFANRVPDGKEKLRNETQLPHPKYTTYKPGKERSRSSSEVITDRTNQRPNLKRVIQGSSQDIFDEVESLPLFISNERSLPPSAPFHAGSRYNATLTRSEPTARYDLDPPPVPQLPFQFRDLPTSPMLNPERAISPTSGFQQASTSTRSSPVSWSALKNASSPRNFSPAPPESGDGLLSRRLRGLDEKESDRKLT